MLLGNRFLVDSKLSEHGHILNFPVMEDEICDKEFLLVMLHGKRFLNYLSMIIS